MRGRFFRSIAAGTLIGAAAGLMVIPEMNDRTRRRIKRVGRQFIHGTEDIIDGIRDYTGNGAR